jgi:iron complex transport system ATP-binding protein
MVGFGRKAQAKAGLAVIFTTRAPDHAFGLADQTLILSPSHPPSLGATKTILTEAMLSRTYGVPIRLIGDGDHIACVAEVD